MHDTRLGLPAGFAALLLLAAPGCGGGDSGIPFGTCEVQGDCAPGTLCVEGYCVPTGGDADAVVPPDGADADAPPPDGADADADADISLTDADGDTIPDDVEGWTDADGDTIPNALDDDSDGDTIPDAIEAGDTDLRTPPPDSDGDGTPDFLDTDSDNDTILDADEFIADTDGDGMPNYRDYDSDGDGIFDNIEAGDRDPSTPPVDSDGDTMPDYLDPDSDNDFISDAEESIIDTDGDTIRDYLDTDSDNDTVLDRDEAGDTELATRAVSCDADELPNYSDTDSDNDGVRDGDELAAGTDPCNPDTDGDGVTDLVEIAYGSDPLVPGDSPRTHGDFVFVEPYLLDPDPWQDTLVFSTSLQKADVYFLVDCTGSMGGEIVNLRATIRSTVIPGIIAAIPDSWTGVGQFDDYPYGGYGGGSDNSYSNLQSMTSDAAAAQAAAMALPNHNGADGPESQVVALWTTATGDPSRTLPRQSATSCAAGRIGYPCFRPDAVRVIMLFTDSQFHNGPAGVNAYGAIPGVTPPTYDMAVSELLGRNIKVIGVNSGSTYGGPHLQAIARDTGAIDSLTGLPMSYDINADGTGLGTQVINAVQTLANNVPIRVDAQFVDDPSDAYDTQTAFLDYIEANVTGDSILDPATGTTRICTTLATGDSDGDGHPDYFPSLLPGTSVCWDIHVKTNETVPATPDAQIFRATINVIGDLFTPLDSRDIFFLVPPDIAGSQ
jgi:hypothetical protein